MSICSEAAADYVRGGFVLVPLKAARKDAVRARWNHREQCVQTAEEAAQLDGNIGLAHAYSRTAALDIDDIIKARPYLLSQGVDLDEISNASGAVMITSGRENRLKLLYRLPQDVPPLATKQLNRHGFELRCATASGLTAQDVLPPSIHPETGRPYEWSYSDPSVGSWRNLPELPPCLLTLWQRLLGQGGAVAPPRAQVLPGQEELRELLRRIDPDIEYPEWIKVGMALHHESGGSDEGLALWDDWSSEGTKYDQQAKVPKRWKSFSSQKGRAVGVGTLRKLADPSSDDFDDLSGTSAPERRRLQVKSAAEFMTRAVSDWWIRDVLPKAALGLVFGASGSGKTFWVLDLVCAISRGAPWRGLVTKKGRVVYVAAEAAGGVAKRTRAYVRHFEAELTDLPSFIDAAPALVEDADLLAQEIDAHGGADIIVIDTLAQTTFGADENSSKDMGAVIGACRKLHELTGALVLLVHHTGKDQTRGARGHSSLRAAADVEIEITRSEGINRSARITKMKDGEDFTSFGFSLLQVAVGWGDENGIETSCVIEHQEGASRAPSPQPKGPWQDAVCDAAADLGEGATKSAIVGRVAAALASSEANAKARGQCRYQAGRALETLCDRGVLEARDGVYARPGAPQAPHAATSDHFVKRVA